MCATAVAVGAPLGYGVRAPPQLDITPRPTWSPPARSCTRNKHSTRADGRPIYRSYQRCEPPGHSNKAVSGLRACSMEVLLVKHVTSEEAATFQWQRTERKVLVLECRLMNENFSVMSHRGLVSGKAGDMLMRGPDGELYACSAVSFPKLYHNPD